MLISVGEGASDFMTSLSSEASTTVDFFSEHSCNKFNTGTQLDISGMFLGAA